MSVKTVLRIKNIIKLLIYLDPEHQFSMTNSSGVFDKWSGSTFEFCHSPLSCRTTNKKILQLFARFFKILKDYFTFNLLKMKRTETVTVTVTITGFRDDESSLRYSSSKNREGVELGVYISLTLLDPCF